MAEQAVRIPGFRGAYTAGSTNWLPDDAELTPGSDLDIMVVVADRNEPDGRRKFIYRDVLVEVSYLRQDQVQSPEQVLSDYHLAPRPRASRHTFCLWRASAIPRCARGTSLFETCWLVMATASSTRFCSSCWAPLE